MPNRIIKDSIRTSKTINTMTDFQFRLWAYLITYVDDYGRGSADPELLKGFVFPRRKGVTESTIEKALSDLANIGSVLLYEVDGEPYFCFPNWSDHQRIQTKKSKFPAPEDGISRKVTVVHGESLPESESNPNPNLNPNQNGSAEPQSASTPPITLPLNDGEEYPVTQGQVSEWEKLYPAVDVMQQLRSMRGWLLSNPAKRKTSRGIQAFITRWLSKEQDKGGRPRSGSSNKSYGHSVASPEEPRNDSEYMMRLVEQMKAEAEKNGG